MGLWFLISCPIVDGWERQKNLQKQSFVVYYSQNKNNLWHHEETEWSVRTFARDWNYILSQWRKKIMKQIATRSPPKHEETEREREREREADSCAYLLRSMGICYSSKYSFFILWVFATVANTHWNFEWVFATHNGYLLP